MNLLKAFLAGLCIIYFFADAAKAIPVIDLEPQGPVREIQGIKITPLSLPYQKSFHSLFKQSTDFLEVRVFEPATLNEPNSERSAASDIIYIHGHSGFAGDSQLLFEKLVAAGHRIIAFSLPEHGNSVGVNLDLMNMTDYAQVVKSLDHYLRKTASSPRPLTLMGFSTGALIAIRIMQRIKSYGAFTDRIPQDLVVVAPALAPKISVFLSTNERLTGDSKAGLQTPFFLSADEYTWNDVTPTEHFFAVLRQRSPYAAPLFALRVLAQGLRARWNGTWWLPFSGKGLPQTTRLTVVSNDKFDTYVNSGPIRRWALNEGRRLANNSVALSYPKNYHGEILNRKSESGLDTIETVVDLLRTPLVPTPSPQSQNLRQCKELL